MLQVSFQPNTFEPSEVSHAESYLERDREQVPKPNYLIDILFRHSLTEKEKVRIKMQLKRLQLVFWMVLSAASASAQTAVTGTGTSGVVPVFNGTSTVTNSIITQSGGKVGIGTTMPDANINIVGSGDPSTFNALRFDSAFGPISWGITANSVDLWGTTLWSWQPNTSNNGGNLAFATGQGTTIAPNNNIRMLIDHNGNVGIGTTSPTQLLEVNGNAKVDGTLTVTGTGGVFFPDGTKQTTAFIPANCGADYAESVGVSGDRTNYTPGDILVIDPEVPGKFLKSNQPYSTLVAGIYSTKPGFVGRKQPANDLASADEVPMAMVGRVPTKVSTENGPIKVGDLLVSSSTMGYAMKGTDRSQMLGTVVGKALGSLDSGTGVIEVLVTLQ